MLDTANSPEYMPSGPLREVGAGGAQWGILSLNKRCVYTVALNKGAGGVIIIALHPSEIRYRLSWNQ